MPPAALSKPRVAIVTAGDSGYFPLLEDLLASLEAARLPAQFVLCAFDLGLTSEQRAQLLARGCRLVQAGWSLDFPGRSAAPAWFGAMVNRPFLPDHFPGFDVYLWIDSDAWVQEPGCLIELVSAASLDEGIALVIEQIGRGTSVRIPQPDGGVRVLHFSEANIRKNLEACYRECFGPEKAHYANEAVTNSGVFALRRESPVWQTWREYLAFGLRKGAKHKLVEQQALNLAFLEGHIAVRDMPARFNWNVTTCHPMLDWAAGKLVEPTGEHLPLGIVHLTDVKRLRGLRLETTSGQTLNVPLKYRDFQAARLRDFQL
jgi:hypothetical protein